MLIPIEQMVRGWRLNRWLAAGGVLAAGIAGLALATWVSIQPIPKSLNDISTAGRMPVLMDRNGKPLGNSLVGRWNIYNTVKLSSVPEFLQQAFLISEDRRFYAHGGADWGARLYALWQNIRALHVVRGASTISEQVVRILHPRPRTYWSRWIEGFEASELERRFSKASILEFYLNQVPYAAQHRGIVAAAYYYFGRNLETLNRKEMLLLAVLVRAPSAYDPFRHPGVVNGLVHKLALRMHKAGLLADHQMVTLAVESLHLQHKANEINAVAFIRHVYSNYPFLRGSTVRTTLDLTLQRSVQELLDNRLHDLRTAHVGNGAAIVIDNADNSILAWAVGNNIAGDSPGSQIDAVMVPRQPGSTLKPFLYALALEHGWTPATLIDDSPIVEAVGNGLHRFRNYSGTHYGNVTLRDALGNSLNIPAVRTIQYVGPGLLLATLRKLGVRNLSQQPDYYGDGLALGDGEVSLYELAQAYSALAKHGEFLPLRVLVDGARARKRSRVFSPEASSLIANILSDPFARRLEFGHGGLLQLPTQSAVKTGTSTGYRDAWIVGFNARYTVAIWMGNLDFAAMDNVTGAAGPGLMLRSVFAVLDRRGDVGPLYLSPRLLAHRVCIREDILPEGECVERSEWFMPGTYPPNPSKLVTAAKRSRIPTLPHIETPTDGLLMAFDPRVPKRKQGFRMSLSQRNDYKRVEWWLDGQRVKVTKGGKFDWLLRRGAHVVDARVWLEGTPQPIRTLPVNFVVK